MNEQANGRPDLARLRDVAERANHDRSWEWSAQGKNGYPQQVIEIGPATLVAECYEGPDLPSTVAEHIATFDPPTVLALLAALAAAEASEREDVEALDKALRAENGGMAWFDASGEIAHAVVASSWLAVHDELVRADERVRLAGEVEAPDDPVWNACWEAVANAAWPKEGATRSEVLDMLMGVRPVPGVRLTEEE